MKKLLWTLLLFAGVVTAQTIQYNTQTTTVKNPDGSTTKQVWLLTYTNGKLTARTLQTSTSTIPTTLVTTAVNAEYNRAATGINQGAALARGLTGAGSTILIMDTGIDLKNKEFAGRIKYSVDYTGTGIQDQVGHGTWVAGIAAAAQDGVGMFGVAPGADLAIAKITNSTNVGQTNAWQALKWAQQYSDIVVANYSASSTYSSSFINGTTRLADGTYYNPTYVGSTTVKINGISQKVTTINGADPNNWAGVLSKEMVLVIAAGNQNLPYVSNPATLATVTDAKGNLVLGGQVIVAGWFNTTTNRVEGQTAGSLCVTVVNGSCQDRYRIKDFYLLAPGTAINTTGLSGYQSVSGTSMAAPAISGAVAVVHQLWPYMKGDQIVQLLLQTANKNLPNYDANIMGQGMLDLDRATQPLGNLKISTTGRTSSTVPISGTLNVPGLSNAVSNTLSSVSVTDELQRDYKVNLKPMLSTASFQPVSYAPRRAGQSWSSQYAGVTQYFNGVTVGSGEGTYSIGLSNQALHPEYQPLQYQMTLTQTQYNPWINFSGMWGESRGATTIEAGLMYAPKEDGPYIQGGILQTAGEYSYSMVSRVTPIYSYYYQAGYRVNGVNFYAGIKPTIFSGSIDMRVPTSTNEDGTMSYTNLSSPIRNNQVGMLGASYAYTHRDQTLNLSTTLAQDKSKQIGVFYRVGF